MFAEHLFARFARTHPLVTISFRELKFPVGSTVEWLSDVDMALCFAPTPHPGVTMQTLWSEPRSLLLHRDHPLAERDTVAVADVVDETFYGSHPSVDPVWAGVWDVLTITGEDHRNDSPTIARSTHSS